MVAVLALVGLTAPAAAAAPPPPECGEPILVLAAMPLELNPLIAAAELDPEPVRVDDRTFYPGRLAGHDVVLAMTGIGLVNAEQTATAAVEHFECPFAAIVYSGVAGSRHNIGDVAVPRRWTIDDGATWVSANKHMVRAARALESPGAVELSDTVPVGDAACLCPGVDAGTPVQMPQPPAVYVGGDGESSDMFGGHAVPCLPGGGDVAGCAPCITDEALGEDVAAFAENAPMLTDTSFWEALLQPPEQTTDTLDAQDMETAAVALVAREHRIPFLGIRAASDGQGDPLHLPGFPAQFFAYRQLAGNNAASVTIAFLGRWAG